MHGGGCADVMRRQRVRRREMVVLGVSVVGIGGMVGGGRVWLLLLLLLLVVIDLFVQ